MRQESTQDKETAQAQKQLQSIAHLPWYKQHYEKVICACCFLILFTNVGLASTSFSVYQPYLVEMPGVGHTGGSIVLSMRTGFSLVCMFFVARYYEALNCRRGVLVGTLLTAMGFLLYSRATSLITLCIGSALTGIGYGLAGTVASTMLIGRWFVSRVGTAAGIAAVGSGVASIVIPPIVVRIIERTSLSQAFGLEALLAAGMGILIFCFLRNDPADMGLRPYVETDTQGKPDKKFKRETPRVTKALPPYIMVLIYGAMVCVGAVSIIAANYLGVLFTSEGFSASDAASLIAISGIALTISKFIIGYVFDRWGTRLGSLVFFILLIGGLALCCVTSQASFAFAACAAVIFGLGLSLGSVGMSVWSIELSPQGRLVKTIRNFQISFIFGGFFFNFFPGILKDLLGSYVISYVILLGMAVMSAIVIVWVYGYVARKGYTEK